MDPNSPKPSHSNNRTVNLEKLQEREDWHMLVVKIIRWENGLRDGGAVTSEDKITKEEWKTYVAKIQKSNTTYSKERVQKDIDTTKANIKFHGGFEDKSI